MKIRTIFSVLAAFVAGAMATDAAAPAGYYDSCKGKNKEALLSALYTITNPHTTVSYSGLWDLYKTSDVYPDGTIWDMYSTKHWSPGTSQCGSYSKVGDCYNREHSFPKSWFDDASPMVSDAFHIYPTDGKVNGQRSNFPYGECEKGTNLGTANGVTALGKLGPCTFSGYSGTVFEPDDEYKGDFARSYFYMAACYYEYIDDWNSAMLAGNKYPAFSNWAINLLLKWHRQDPVSPKELARQEVVYGRQRNRNPFIDYPEMAEYIWGDKKTESWTPGGGATISLPVAGSTITLNTVSAGIAAERTVTVRTTGATESVKVTITGASDGIQSATYTLSAADANAGTAVKVNVNGSAVKTYTAKITVSTGTATSTATLSCQCVAGLPLKQPTVVFADGFVVEWTYIGDAYSDASGEYYILNIQGAPQEAPYIINVAAKAEKYTVTDLDADTDYTITLSSKNNTSTTNAHTGALLPGIEFLYDGELALTQTVGAPSDIAELLISTENVYGSYTVRVDKPFEISVDRATWGTKVTVDADEDRIYLRLNSEKAGSYTTAITAEYEDYENNDAVAYGTAISAVIFKEDFEANQSATGTYSTGTLQGSACMWLLSDAGTFSGDKAHSGNRALRCGRSTAADIRMDEDYPAGISTASFYAMRWGSDAEAVIDVQYSIDGGVSYTTAGTVTIDASDYKQYTVHVGSTKPTRIRFFQQSGKRFMLDDVELTANTTGVADPEAQRHQWTAYSHGGTLYIETATDGLEIAIYGIDGTTLHCGATTAGTMTFGGLRPGSFYIVACGDFSRTVMIR